MISRLQKTRSISMIFLKKTSQTKILFAVLLVIINLTLFSLLNIANSSKTFETSRNLAKDVEYVSSKNMDFNQLSEYFEELSEKYGAEYSFEVLKVANVPPNTDMHLLGHVVGDQLYKQKGVDGIKVCSDDFRNACSHSIVVGLLLEQGEGVLPDIASACRQAPGGKGAYTMCFHGLGHGVLAYTGYEMESAVDLCKKVGTIEYGNQEMHQCISGIMMEMVTGVHDVPLWQSMRPKYFKLDDPLYPCTADFIPDESRYLCLVYITPHLFEAAGGSIGTPIARDFEIAFGFCDRLPEKDFSLRDACFGGFGKEFVGIAKARDIRNVDVMTTEQIDKIISWCGLTFDQKGEGSCIVHALNSLYWGGENEPSSAISLCSQIVNQDLKTSCYDALFNAVSFYKNEKDYKTNFCNLIESGFVTRCKNVLLK